MSSTTLPLKVLLCITFLSLALLVQSSASSNKPKNGYYPSTTPAVKQSSCAVTSKFDQTKFLNLHNTARKSVHAKAMTWSDDLANSAQCWANRCQFEHSGASKSGENIAAGSGPNYGIRTAFLDWWNEWHKWRSGMGFQESTGHFTQVAWKGSTQVGCGVASCSASQLGLGGTYQRAKFVVCQYSPPGNVIGQFKGQVERPKKNVFAKHPSPRSALSDGDNSYGSTDGTTKQGSDEDDKSTDAKDQDTSPAANESSSTDKQEASEENSSSFHLTDLSFFPGKREEGTAISHHKKLIRRRRMT